MIQLLLSKMSVEFKNKSHCAASFVAPLNNCTLNV